MPGNKVRKILLCFQRVEVQQDSQNYRFQTFTSAVLGGKNAGQIGSVNFSQNLVRSVWVESGNMNKKLLYFLLRVLFDKDKSVD